MIEKIRKSEEDWKKILGSERFVAVRQNGTEPAFENAYWDNKIEGVYHCAACDLPLFRSEDKFDSGTGWPSFAQPVAPDHVAFKDDCSQPGPCRTSVECARCDSHLGHSFDDLKLTWKSPGDPPKAGKRYCMNSIALNFFPITDEK